MELDDLLQDYITCLNCSRTEQEQVGALVDLLGGLVARGEKSGLAGVGRFKLNLKAYRMPGAGINTLSNEIFELSRRLLNAQEPTGTRR